MYEISETSDRLEFRKKLSVATRLLIFVCGLLPFLAPYELLIRPRWEELSGPIWMLCVSISAGAVLVSLFFFAFAILGLNQVFRFDLTRHTMTYGFDGPLLRYRQRTYAARDVQRIDIERDSGTDGPDYYNLVVVTSTARFSFGEFSSRQEAERYKSQLDRWTSNGSKAQRE